MDQNEDGQALEQGGHVCTVREVALAVVVIASSEEPPRDKVMPTKLKEVLKEWGCMWMWKSLRIVGDEQWIRQSIE